MIQKYSFKNILICINNLQIKMKILFLSISNAVSKLDNRGIYPDLLRYMANQGHDVYIVCPFERRTNKKTNLYSNNNVKILGVKTLNITKSSFIEKGIATLLIEFQFAHAINKFFPKVKFDLILYSTPPITFNSLIEKLKMKNQAFSFLMLKDIFPQNAVDLLLIKKGGLLYNFFKKKEEQLYLISDFIGCMSQGNIDYLKDNYNFIDNSKLLICPNAIEVIKRDVINRNLLLSKYEIPYDKTIFIFGGNLGVGQGIEFLLDCLYLNLEREDVFFVIVGSGNKFLLIQSWINKYKPKNVKLLRTLSKVDFDQLEASCDVGMVFLDIKFTIPNFPSRILSYMESKLPLLICTDRKTDLGKIAEANNFGKWCQSDDTFQFKKLVDFYVENPDIRRKMGEHGYNFLVQNYSVKRAYDSIMLSLKS